MLRNCGDIARINQMSSVYIGEHYIGRTSNKNYREILQVYVACTNQMRITIEETRKKFKPKWLINPGYGEQEV